MMTVRDDQVVAHALFCSTLQPGQANDSRAVASALRATLDRYPEVHTLVDEVAQRYGDDQETAAARMRWCLRAARARMQDSRRNSVG